MDDFDLNLFSADAKVRGEWLERAILEACSPDKEALKELPEPLEEAAAIIGNMAGPYTKEQTAVVLRAMAAGANPHAHRWLRPQLTAEFEMASEAVKQIAEKAMTIEERARMKEIKEKYQPSVPMYCFFAVPPED